jgi:hypothetical protein
MPQTFAAALFAMPIILSWNRVCVMKASSKWPELIERIKNSLGFDVAAKASAHFRQRGMESWQE